MSRKKILLVDDEEDFCFFTRLNLEKTGKYKVFAATSGAEGVRLAKQLKPDLIFLDIIMPKMDGGQVAKALLEDELTSEIPFVFVSAVIKKDEITKHGEGIKARDFIAKPVTPEKLIQKIEQLLVHNYCALMESCVSGPLALVPLYAAQHVFLMALFMATLFFASFSTWNTANAGSASSRLTVSARVLPRQSLQMLHHVPRITVTSADIQRGHVDLKSASRIEIKSNGPAGFMIIFQGIEWPFREIHVQGLTNETRISSGNSFVYQAYNRGTVTIELGYRLFITKDAKPGSYGLPRIVGEFLH